MARQQKFFPNQENEEKVFLLIRKHWFNYATFFFLDILMIIPPAIFTIYWVINPDLLTSSVGITFFIGISIFVLFMLAAQLYGFVSFYLDVYIVTDQRIVDISQDGFFKRKISELHLHQVQDVSAQVEGFWNTLLHFGDVHIQTAGERENFIFASIPNPYNIAKQIVNLHENHLERSSLKSNQKKIRAGAPISDSDDDDLPYGKTGPRLENPVIKLAEIKSSKRVQEVDEKEKIVDKDDRKKKLTAAGNGVSIANRVNGSNKEEGELEEGKEISLNL